MPLGGDLHVARLEIPVDDAGLVGRLHPHGDLAEDVQGVFHGDRTEGEPVREVLPLHVLQDEVFGALGLLQAVDARHVGVAQGGEDLRLPFEARKSFGIGGELLGQGLDGHGAFQAGVVSEEDDSHPAAAQFAIYPVGTDLFGLVIHSHTSAGPTPFSLRYTQETQGRVSPRGKGEGGPTEFNRIRVRKFRPRG